MVAIPRTQSFKIGALRNAFTDDDAESVLLREGPCSTPPLVTIAIPTFRRPAMLAEAVRSAIGQQLDRPFEVIVVDNDPESDGLARLLAEMPEVAGLCFRYFRNTENVGLYGNWNRGIWLARGTWVTVLNDDDLLDTNFLALMFAALDKDSGIDGIVCRKRLFDQRGANAPAAPDTRQFAKRGINLATLRGMVFGKQRSYRQLLRGVRGRLEFEYIFGAQVTRRIRPRNLFAGAMLGNGGGFLFRRAKAVELGGYYPEEYPPADYWFYVRFAKLFHLREHRATAASVRQAENESAKPETVRGCFRTGYDIQKALAESDVPRWWLRFSPQILALHRSYHRQVWGYELSDAEVEELVHMRLPAEKPRLLAAVRLVLRWF